MLSRRQLHQARTADAAGHELPVAGLAENLSLGCDRAGRAGPCRPGRRVTSRRRTATTSPARGTRARCASRVRCAVGLEHGEVGVGADRDRRPCAGRGRRARAGVVDIRSTTRCSGMPRCAASVATTGSIGSRPLPAPGSCVHTSAPGCFGSGAWSEPIVWTWPSRSSSQSRSTDAGLRLGGFHLRRPSFAMSSVVRQR